MIGGHDTSNILIIEMLLLDMSDYVFEHDFLRI